MLPKYLARIRAYPVPHRRPQVAEAPPPTDAASTDGWRVRLMALARGLGTAQAAPLGGRDARDASRARPQRRRILRAPTQRGRRHRPRARGGGRRRQPRRPIHRCRGHACRERAYRQRLPTDQWFCLYLHRTPPLARHRRGFAERAEPRYWHRTTGDQPVAYTGVRGAESVSYRTTCTRWPSTAVNGRCSPSRRAPSTATEWCGRHEAPQSAPA
jgi:hypothetical protein